MHATQPPHAEPGERIAGLAKSSEAASLGLLMAIDGTVDSLLGFTEVMSGYARVLDQAAEEVATLAVRPGDYLDAEDVAVDALAGARSQLQNLLVRLVRKRATLTRDRRLPDDHRDALHEAHESAEAAAAMLIEVLEKTRSAILAHDLAAEPRESLEVFATVEELIDSLRRR